MLAGSAYGLVPVFSNCFNGTGWVVRQFVSSGGSSTFANGEIEKWGNGEMGKWRLTTYLNEYKERAEYID